MNSYLLCGHKEESIDHLSLSQDKDFMAVDAFFVQHILGDVFHNDMTLFSKKKKKIKGVENCSLIHFLNNLEGEESKIF